MTPTQGTRRLGGRFLVEATVGRGGNGIVYRAWDTVTEQQVALKLLEGEGGADPTLVDRMEQEGRLLASLSHPGIVRTVAWGTLPDAGGVPFVAMEWLDGEDLATRQRRDPLTTAEAIEIVTRVGRALQAAHEAGVVHRDIKPSNVFLCRCADADGGFLHAEPKLVDFGVAISHGSPSGWGDIAGTPAYMAPEQARGDADLDVRCDIYSLGAMLFELVCGRPPHIGPTPIATLARLATTPAPHMRELRQDVSNEFDDLVARMLATDRQQRPESVEEVLRALASVEDLGSRLSWAEPSSDMVASTRLGSSASRLLTTIVATRLPIGSPRDRALEHLRARGAIAVPLGKDAVVAHLGAHHAVGTEAATALDLGRRLARAGAQVGIASGRARVHLTDPAGNVQPVGEVVDRASALARDASQGQVLADVTTSELGRGRFEFRSREDGASIVGEPLRAHRGERLGGAPFVGREPELALVMATYRRAVSERMPLLTTISGPPGIGKTRLRREVIARISSQAEAPDIIFQRSDAYGRGHALGAAADILRAMIGLAKGVDPAEAETAIVARLGPATRQELTASDRRILASLLANQPLPAEFDPRGARDALWLAMTDLVIQAVETPTAMVLEDLQWADPESIGWLDHMLGRARGRPLLVLAMVRPSFWVDQPQRFAGRDHVRIELRPISQTAARAIARALLGDAASEQLVERIAQQSAGLPLFAEELARLSAQGRDTEHAPTIESAIQVSLDSLDEECRDAVGRLSVLGQSCWDAALEALGMSEAESMMRTLAAAELLTEQLSSRFPGTREWMFKHALVREVAYASLGEAERRELHGLAAEWLATMGEDAATVAGHFDRGGRSAEAALHWEKAARHALVTNALKDALAMADRALGLADSPPVGFERAALLDEVWSRLDPRSADRETAVRALEDYVHDEASGVRARGARARYDDARGTGEQVSARLAQARDEASALGLHDEEANCSAALALRLAYAGRFEAAETEARRLLGLAESHRVASAAIDGWQAIAIVQQTRGGLGTALEARRNAVAAARRAGLREREAMLTTNLGFALTTIGARQESRAALLAGMAVAGAIGSDGAVRHAQMNLLGWSATFGRDPELDRHLGEIRADADAAAGGIWASPDRSNLGVLFYRGWELLRGKRETSCSRSRALLRTAAMGYRSAGHLDVLPVALALWAEAERRCNDATRAVELTTEAAALVERDAPSLLNESVIYLVMHDAYLDLGDQEHARISVERAMPRLVRRLRGLMGTPYARQFLTELPHNAGLLAAAEAYGAVPDPVHRILSASP